MIAIQSSMGICWFARVGRLADAHFGRINWLYADFKRRCIDFDPETLNKMFRDLCTYVLRAAAKGHAFTDGHLSTIAHLTGDELRTHRFPFPPIPEQNRIVRYLDRTTGDIEMTTNRVGHQIELSQEYRTRLIADVVTGKLDVREAAAELPEVDSLAEDDLDGTIHDRENSNPGELDAEESAEGYTISKEMPL